MKLFTGLYAKIKEVCNALFADGYFEFQFLYVPDGTRFQELNRFLYESRHTLRFENEYTGNLVLDLSEWNHKPLNHHFEAFLYYLKDNRHKYNCALIVNGHCSDELRETLQRFFDNLTEIQQGVPEEPKKIRIGFTTEKEETDYV